MKAVFLDRNTFSERINFPAPHGVSDWIVYQETVSDNIFARVQDADIVVTNKVVLDSDLLAKLPRLRLIQVAATGTNNVDRMAAQHHNIAVKNVAGYSVESVAEHVFMLMLAAMRGLKPYHQAVLDGSWQVDGRFCLTEPQVFSLAGKTLGIVGVGDIGRALTIRAQAFGMNVLWAERRGVRARSPDYTLFETVLEQSDVISLNCPLTEQTHHLVNDKTIAMMRKKPLLINCARGSVVNPQAVCTAIEQESLLGFATDVFTQEPPDKNDPLLKIAGHPRVIYSPHIAWASEMAQDKLWQILCTQIESFIQTF